MIPIREIEQQSVALISWFSIFIKSYQFLGLKLRKMVVRGWKKLLVINPVDFDFNFDIAAKSIPQWKWAIWCWL